jgi:hypothetical protein
VELSIANPNQESSDATRTFQLDVFHVDGFSKPLVGRSGCSISNTRPPVGTPHAMLSQVRIMFNLFKVPVMRTSETPSQVVKLLINADRPLYSQTNPQNSISSQPNPSISSFWSLEPKSGGASSQPLLPSYQNRVIDGDGNDLDILLDDPDGEINHLPISQSRVVSSLFSKSVPNEPQLQQFRGSSPQDMLDDGFLPLSTSLPGFPPRSDSTNIISTAGGPMGQDNISSEELLVTNYDMQSTSLVDVTQNDHILYHKDELFCICRKPEDGTWMISCDGGCNGRFHGGCVNINENDVDFIDKYICMQLIQLGKASKTVLISARSQLRKE